MKVLVCGSRDFTNLGAIRAFMLTLPKDTIIIHGGARGADTLAGVAAKELGMPVQVFPADWQQYGRSAGIRRNLAMLDENPDQVVAFWDGHSSGTAHTIREAQHRDIPTKVIIDK